MLTKLVPYVFDAVTLIVDYAGQPTVDTKVTPLIGTLIWNAEAIGP